MEKGRNERLRGNLPSKTNTACLLENSEKKQGNTPCGAHFLPRGRYPSRSPDIPSAKEAFTARKKTVQESTTVIGLTISMYSKRSRRAPVPVNRSYLACIASAMFSTPSIVVDPIGAVPISWAKESFRLFGLAGASEASRTSPSWLRRPFFNVGVMGSDSSSK